MPEKNTRWETRAAKLFCISIIVLIFWLTFKYIIGIIFPFVISFSVAAIVYPLSEKTAKKIKIPQKLLAFIYVIVVIAALGIGITFAINRGVSEISALLIRLEEQGDGIISSAENFVDRITDLISKIPLLRNLKSIEGANEMLANLLQTLLGRIGGFLTSLLGNILINTPSALFTVIITIISCFYLSMDFKKICTSLWDICPESISVYIKKITPRLKKALKQYFYAYLIIFLITFAELFIGLWILKRKYSFLIAILIALVDVLPIFGTGIVLIPWGLIMILNKNYYVGFGLLIVYAIITIVRQIIEPHIIGGKLGLHPLFSIFSMFAGLKLFGFIGMIIAPGIAVFIKEFICYKNKKLEK